MEGEGLGSLGLELGEVLRSVNALAEANRRGELPKVVKTWRKGNMQHLKEMLK